MKDKVIKILKIVAFASVGIILFWLVYRNQDKETIIQALKTADYKWILISLIFGFFALISRTLRWSMLLEPMGYKPRKINLFFSIMIMYLVNYAIPRSGEVVRCGLIDRYEKIPFSKLLGTVFTERIIDFLVLIILFFVLLLTQFPVVSEFIQNNITQNQDMSSKMQGLYMLLIISAVAGLLMLALLYIFRNKLKTLKIYKKIEELIKNFIIGIKSVWMLEKKWSYILQTILMWGAYYMMLYLCFFSFEFTSHLSPMVALAVVILASFGMVVPAPGGMGAWHFLAIQTLVIYGIKANPDGNAFAIVAHESQAIFMILFGLISFILMPIVNKNNL